MHFSHIFHYYIGHIRDFLNSRRYTSPSDNKSGFFPAL